MSKILVLKSSIMGKQSRTNALVDSYLEARKKRGEQDQIIERDLAQSVLPAIDHEIFFALRGAENPSERAQQAILLSDQLIAELKDSDLVVIGAPMYNLNVPSQLKNWFDLIARARVTFKYTETYPVGLIEGVSAVIISSSGGIHVGAQTDAVTPYLRAVLSLVGINEVSFVYAEGMDLQPNGIEKGLANAHARIAQLTA